MEPAVNPQFPGEFGCEKSRVTCLGVEDPHAPITVMGQGDSVSYELRLALVLKNSVFW